MVRRGNSGSGFVAVDAVQFRFLEDCIFNPDQAKPIPTTIPPTTTKPPTTVPPTTTIEPTEPPDCTSNSFYKYFSVTYHFNVINVRSLNFPFFCHSIGTIVCDFNNDWCEFSKSMTGDDKSKSGFGWIRKSSNQIKDQSMEGPEQGGYKMHYSCLYTFYYVEHFSDLIERKLYL